MFCLATGCLMQHTCGAEGTLAGKLILFAIYASRGGMAAGTLTNHLYAQRYAEPAHALPFDFAIRSGFSLAINNRSADRRVAAMR